MSDTTTRRNADGKFTKGQSGNPTGRPRSRADKATMNDAHQVLLKVAFAPVSRTADGKRETITRLEALLVRLWGNGVQGDTRAAEKFLSTILAPSNIQKLVPSPDAIRELLEDDAAILENHNAKLRQAEEKTYTSDESEKDATDE
jgi:hypothetical protein